MPESVVHFQIRMPPRQHEKLASWAKEDKLSLNLLVVGILEKAMADRKPELARGNRARLTPASKGDAWFPLNRHALAGLELNRATASDPRCERLPKRLHWW